jgi:deoxyadenosine/deoxycytidine kinase
MFKDVKNEIIRLKLKNNLIYHLIVMVHNEHHSPIVVVVDGIIGSGKSTIIRECLIPILTKKGWRVTEVREPVEIWRKTGRLDDFYKNPSRRGFQFQTMVFHDRVAESQQKHQLYKDSTDVFLLERSVFTDILFMQMLRESGTIEQGEYDDYLRLWTMWEKVMPFKPDLFVYLKPDLKICMERLRERHRGEELSVDIDYQCRLETKHDEFLGKEFVAISDCHYVPRLLLKTNSNFRDDPEIQLELSEQLENALKTIRERQSSAFLEKPTKSVFVPPQ